MTLVTGETHLPGMEPNSLAAEILGVPDETFGSKWQFWTVNDRSPEEDTFLLFCNGVRPDQQLCAFIKAKFRPTCKFLIFNRHFNLTCKDITALMLYCLVQSFHLRQGKISHGDYDTIQLVENLCISCPSLLASTYHDRNVGNGNWVRGYSVGFYQSIQ